MKGVIIINLLSGSVLFHLSFDDNFGLPINEDLSFCKFCNISHTDEMNLAAFIFALSTYAGGIYMHIKEKDGSVTGKEKNLDGSRSEERSIIKSFSIGDADLYFNVQSLNEEEKVSVKFLCVTINAINCDKDFSRYIKK